MPQNIHIKPLLSLFASFFVLNLVSEINSYILPNFLMEKGLMIVELEHIELLKILSSIIVGLLLIQIVNLFRGKKILLVSLIFFLISMVGATVVNNHNLMRIFLMIMAGSSFSYNVLSLIKACDYSQNYKKFTLWAFFILWISGIAEAENLHDFLKHYNPNYILILNIIACGIIVIINTFLADIKPIYSIFAATKFSDLIKNIELQLIIVLVTSYVIVDIFWYYDIVALIENLPILDAHSARKYMLFSILLFIIPVLWVIDIFNRYLLNILFITVFFISVVMLLNYSKTTTSNIITLGLIGICLYAVFICNILILYSKFDGKELRTSLLIYFTMASVGQYIGALSAHRGNNIIDEKRFLISIYLIIAALLLYYITQFIKLKLYRY